MTYSHDLASNLNFLGINLKHYLSSECFVKPVKLIVLGLNAASRLPCSGFLHKILHLSNAEILTKEVNMYNEYF